MPKKPKIDKDDYQSDVLDLCRKILNGVRLSDINFADQLEGEERLEFLKYCNLVAENPWFDKIISNLYFPHIIHAVTQASNYDETTFSRATINGVSLTREFFIKYSLMYTEEIKKQDEEFDKNKAFDPLEAENFFKR